MWPVYVPNILHGAAIVVNPLVLTLPQNRTMEDPSVTELQTKLDILQQIKALHAKLEIHPPAMPTSPILPGNGTPATPHVKNVKVPEGRYNMSLAEFRTFSTDCRSYLKLTNLTDAQVVLQLRLHMDSDLKRAIDTNYLDWDTKTVEEAIATVGEIVHQTSNPAVYIKEFDNMVQGANEPIQEFVTTLHSCAIDCSFTFPFHPTHDLTDYMIINCIRSGVSDKTLQQELFRNKQL